MAHTQEPLTPAEFGKLVKPLFGLTIGKSWFNDGGQLFLELGATKKGRGYVKWQGQASIFTGSLWALEAPGGVVVSSQVDVADRKKAAKTLHDRKVTLIQLGGKGPDLGIDFGGGTELTAAGNQWAKWHVVIHDPRLLPKIKAYQKVSEILIGPNPAGPLTKVMVKPD